MVLHYASIVTAITGVVVSNYYHKHPSKAGTIISNIITLMFAVLCFREVSWIGLFLAFMSPNVTDVVLSIPELLRRN